MEAAITLKEAQASTRLDGDGESSPSNIAVALIDNLRTQAATASAKLIERREDIHGEIVLLNEHIDNLRAESNELDKAVAQLEAFTTV
jgi:hypothetical protein